jgi:hypothetical protein
MGAVYTSPNEIAAEKIFGAKPVRRLYVQRGCGLLVVYLWWNEIRPDIFYRTNNTGRSTRTPGPKRGDRGSDPALMLRSGRHQLPLTGALLRGSWTLVLLRWALATGAHGYVVRVTWCIVHTDARVRKTKGQCRFGDGRATHEQSHVPCLCPSGEYRSLASLGYRNHLTRASSPCQVSKGRVVAPSDPPNQGAFPLIIPFCGLVAH